MSQTDAALFAKYQPVFDRIGAGALDREKNRVLPHEQVRWLADAGFGAVRGAAESGGDGATLTQLIRLLIALAAADSAVPQALRGHIAFVEDRLYAPASPARDVWLARFVAGDIVGNAWTEIAGGAFGPSATTRVERTDEGWQLTGAKFYTTGSIFAQWIDVTATDGDGRDVTALVSTAATGVTVSDDWDGFGQRLSGSGAAQFDNAVVAADHVFAFSERFPYQTALYQAVLLAVLAGIAVAVERDAAGEVRGRARVYSHGNSAATRDDPQVQQAVGQISARAYAAVATTVSVGAALQRAWEAHLHAGGDEHAANVAAEIESAQAQIVVIDLVLRTATDLFDVLGASGVRAGKALDRHWRNARTVASHNPWLFKARIVGDWAINDTTPPFLWTLDNTPAQKSGSPG